MKNMTNRIDSIKAYRNFGISEWNEKCLVMSEEEIQEVVRELEEGETSPLLEIVKLPFPHFSAIYLQRFPSANSYIKDPAIGYKMYLLPDNILKYMFTRLRYPEKKMNDLRKELKVGSLELAMGREIISGKLEDSLKIMSAISQNRVIARKFVYLSQYIDFTEAQRLNLSMVPYFELASSDGYELDKKLDLLNSGVRTIMSLILGLYGEKRHSYKEIGERLSISADRVHNIVEYIFDLFFRPTVELKDAIGLKPLEYRFDDTRQYTNWKYRDMDISIETDFIRSFLPPLEKEVLNSYSKKEARLYIASKYMFKTPGSLASNMSLTIDEAKSRLGIK